MRLHPSHLGRVGGRNGYAPQAARGTEHAQPHLRDGRFLITHWGSPERVGCGMTREPQPTADTISVEGIAAMFSAPPQESEVGTHR